MTRFTNLTMATIVCPAAMLAMILQTTTAEARATDARPDALAVETSDLDLGTHEGQRTLEKRIDRAARKLCLSDATVTGSRMRSKDASDCYRQALARARVRMADATTHQATALRTGA